MIGSTAHQTSLFFLALHREAALIKDDLLDPIDKLLEDEEIVRLARLALAARRPRSRTTGRAGLAPDRLLRCSVLKHMKGWSFRELEREVRSSLVYRQFTHFYDDRVPDYTTFSRNFALIDEDLTRRISSEVVLKAAQEKVVRGNRLRTDTTVVETNIHYPTDSTLLADGVRVLTRTLKRVAAECAPGAVTVADHARATKRRVIEIHRAAKAVARLGRERITQGYSKLIGIVRKVAGQAEEVAQSLREGRLPVIGKLERVMALEATLAHYTPLVKRVINQASARIFDGNNHVPNKLLSLFETHTQVICKGKAHKPSEFGRLVRIDEVENGVVSSYEIAEGNKADQTNWEPALEQHMALFGVPPRMATGDRGFFSAKNELVAKSLGIERVALPGRGRLSETRRALQKERWFREAQRWRAGIESRIATLKHRLGMARAFYKTERGLERWVGWSVITNNLVAIARHKARKEARRHAT